MKRVKGLPFSCALAAFCSVVILSGVARAEFSTERPGSILIFPKVINADGRDTVIQITNTGNMVRQAHCFYVNAATGCQVTDFEVNLTRQQPTHWLASTGRRVSATDDVQGLDPGAIPPLPPDFVGSLYCAEIDLSGAEYGANTLTGEATVSQETGGDPAKYNAIGIPSISTGNTDLDADLDNVEYAACPAGLHYNFQAEGANDSVIAQFGGPDEPPPPGWPATPEAIVNNNLVLVPCSQDFRTLSRYSVGVWFDVYNEFEEHRSGSHPVGCWESINGDDPYLGALQYGSLGSEYGYARLTPTSGNGVGVIGVATTRRTDTNTGATGTDTKNLHFMGNSGGWCVQSPTTPCSVDADCGSADTCSGVTNLPGAKIRLRDL